jgi:hypothetical protein
MYIAWKGDGNDNLNVMVSTDKGQTFGNKFISPETSPQAPALAAHNGNLYIAWKATVTTSEGPIQLSRPGSHLFFWWA